jgi:hypothetical protein
MHKQVIKGRLIVSEASLLKEILLQSNLHDVTSLRVDVHGIHEEVFSPLRVGNGSLKAFLELAVLPLQVLRLHWLLVLEEETELEDACNQVVLGELFLVLEWST